MGGCLWCFLPLLILIPLYAIIRQPIKYMMGINDVEILNQIAQVVDWNSIAAGSRRQAKLSPMWAITSFTCPP